MHLGQMFVRNLLVHVPHVEACLWNDFLCVLLSGFLLPIFRLGTPRLGMSNYTESKHGALWLYGSKIGGVGSVYGQVSGMCDFKSYTADCEINLAMQYAAFRTLTI